MTKKILICLTLNQSSAILTHHLLKENWDVTIYIDRDVTSDFAEKVLRDLSNVCEDEIRVTRDKDWKKYTHIIFPNLDCAPSCSDQEFGKAMSELFNNHLENVKIKEGSVVVFADNLRGLFAANEFQKAHSKRNLKVISLTSIYYLATKGGQEEDEDGNLRWTPALPDLDGKIFTFGHDLPKVEHLAGKWEWNMYPLTEAESMFSAISELLNTGEIYSVFVGRQPNNLEVDLLPVKKGFLSFLQPRGVEEEIDTGKAYENYLKRIFEYIEADYSKM